MTSHCALATQLPDAPLQWPGWSGERIIFQLPALPHVPDLTDILLEVG